MRFCIRLSMVLGLTCCLGTTASLANLIVNGDFEGCPSGKVLRQDNKGQDWYESRRNTKKGRSLLKLSRKAVGGNTSRKAMIQAHPDFNTYLSQRFTTPQTGDVTVQYDILVRRILPDDNRSAFFMVGNNKDGKGGPNSTGAERFVFLGFENGAQQGHINLFAREKNKSWKDRTVVARDLQLDRWYTIVVEIYVGDKDYEVTVKGVTEPMALQAFSQKGKTPKRLTNLSFASWNDGAGTFYVDNVVAFEE